jgi:hypothetical protein
MASRVSCQTPVGGQPFFLEFHIGVLINGDARHGTVEIGLKEILKDARGIANETCTLRMFALTCFSHHLVYFRKLPR